MALSFDLTPFAAQDRSLKRPLFWLRLAFSAAIPVVLVASFWADYSKIARGGLSQEGSAVIVGTSVFVTMISAVAVLTMLQLLPAASRITFDDLGVRLDYRSGKSSLSDWHSGKFRMVLMDFSADPTFAELKSRWTLDPGAVLLGLFPLHPTTLLSEEAASTMLKVSSERGLRIDQSIASFFRYGSRPMVYNIGPPGRIGGPLTNSRAG